MEKSITSLNFKKGKIFKTRMLIYYFLIICLHLYMQNWFLAIIKCTWHELLHMTIVGFFLNLIYYVSAFLIFLFLDENHYSFKIFDAYFKYCFATSFAVCFFYTSSRLVDFIIDFRFSFYPLGLDLFLHGGNILLMIIEQSFIFPKSDSKFTSFMLYYVQNLIYNTIIYKFYVWDGFVTYPYVKFSSALFFTSLSFLAGLVGMTADKFHNYLIRYK